MRPEAERWLSRALSDLDDAHFLLGGRRHAAAGFMAQQAAEKALKALVIERSGDFPRIHDLVPLGQQVEAPDAILQACEVLSPAYVAYRYPDVEEPLTPDDSQELVRRAEEVIDWARRHLS